jgi:enoyl-CoA hydratase/carnithine racemase
MISKLVDDGVAILTIETPHRNAISDVDVVDALIATLESVDTDEAVRVAVLTGAGAAFSSGGNLRQMGRHGGINDAEPVLTRQNYRRGIQRIPLAFERLELPIIAAVNGPAIGAGCDLACMCDVRIASEQASFAESFVKVGLVPGDGGAWLLPRIVGFSKACEMALTGDAVSAEEALAIGLVSRVVPDDQLLPEALLLAARIAANPRHATRLTKRLMRESSRARLDEILELSGALQALLHTTQDHVEAVDAMLAKRAPDFRGH